MSTVWVVMSASMFQTSDRSVSRWNPTWTLQERPQQSELSAVSVTSVIDVDLMAVHVELMMPCPAWARLARRSAVGVMALTRSRFHQRFDHVVIGAELQALTWSTSSPRASP